MKTAAQSPAGTLATRRALLLAAVCCLIGVLGLALLGPAVAVLTTYRATGSRPASSGPAAVAITERVVLVVLSGVGNAVLEEGGDPWRFVQLRRLAGEGAYGTIRAIQPSGDAPTWAALLSGADPAATGIVDVEEADPPAVPTLFDQGRSVGVPSLVVATRAAWEPRSRLAVPDETLLAPSSAGVAEMAAGHLSTPGRSLAVVLLDAGRVSGIRAAERWARLDGQIASIAAALDPARDTLIVTSDHGLLADGSSGGGEAALVNLPLVMWGRGIVPGRQSLRGQLDVAPTIALLLGLPYGAGSGRPMFDALRLDPRNNARERVRLLEARIGMSGAGEGRAAEALASARRALDRQDWPAAVGAAEQGLVELSRASRPAAVWTSEWLWGAAVPLALVILALLLARLPRKRRLLLPLAGLEAYLLAWALIYFGLARKPLSLSAVYGEWSANLLNIAVWSAVALAAMAIGMGLYRAKAGTWAAAERTGWSTVFILVSLAVFAVLSLLVAGPSGGRLPGLGAWTAVLLALAQVTGTGLAAPVAIALAAMIAEIVGRGR